MVTLTTRQRDLLFTILQAEAPIGAAAIAEQMHLTPRQVNYGLHGVKQWLAGRDICLKSTPGVGIQVVCSTAVHRTLVQDLNAQKKFQLVLDATERQQLFALALLTSDEPLILFHLQQHAQVSRTTVLKDLESVGRWLQGFELTLNSRPNVGFWLEGAELARRQALTALLWGNDVFEEPLLEMQHGTGLHFNLAGDARLLPILQQTDACVQSLDTDTGLARVAQAEVQLGGRFTDIAVLALALAFAVQVQRIGQGHFVSVPEPHITWLQTRAVWATAAQLLNEQCPQCPGDHKRAETAAIAMQLLAAARNDRWPGDLAIDEAFTDLITLILEVTAKAYRMPDLTHDNALRDGLISHIIPACLQQRFGLWAPPSSHTRQLSARFAFDQAVAQELAEEIERHTGTKLPTGEINNLALLLRAAFIRERPYRSQRVIVVCPSGMATSQLLLARLKARFPRLGPLEVCSLRELSEAQLESAQLIITTMPLPPALTGEIDVIQVHPLLLPEDIQRITYWLA